MTIVTPPPAINRDRWGRPLVIPQGGGKPIPYTRCTTYIDVIEDKYNLQKWMQRMVALGIAGRPDLLLSVSAHREDKRALDKICDDAREAAQASAAATTGTALHALTEVMDRGQELPVGLPAGAKASLDAYATATAGLKATHIEQFTVLDTLKIGGTPDRIVKVKGETTPKIADLKTGSIEWGFLKIAAQLAVYSRSYVYDIATGERSVHGADTTEGIVIHLPAVEDPAEARCDLYRVNLTEGWNAVLVAKGVREKRGLKFADLMQPMSLDSGRLHPSEPSLEDRIKACATADDVRALWAAHASEWTDNLTAVAKGHISLLAQQEREPQEGAIA